MAKTTLGFWNQFWTKLPVAYRGALIVGIPVIAILPAIAGWNWSNRIKADANRWISHTQDVIRESNSLVGVLVDAQTGVRGYTITQKPEFLEPYNRATKEIPVSLEELEILVQDNPQQQQRLKDIEQQITTRLNLLTQILNQLKISQGELTPQLIELFTREEVDMDRVRNLVDTFKAKEWRLLNIRQQHLKQVGRITEILPS
jgi:CHASE3 domain sensor protein